MLPRFPFFELWNRASLKLIPWFEGTQLKYIEPNQEEKSILVPLSSFLHVPPSTSLKNPRLSQFLVASADPSSSSWYFCCVQKRKKDKKGRDKTMIRTPSRKCVKKWNSVDVFSRWNGRMIVRYCRKVSVGIERKEEERNCIPKRRPLRSCYGL